MYGFFNLMLSRNTAIDKAAVSRILVRAANWVGDAVMTLPALEAVRENFPEADITVLAKPWVAPVYANHPAVDDVWLLLKGEGAFAGFGDMGRSIRRIQRARFDLAVLFQNAFEAALLTCLGRVPFRIGFRTDGRGPLLTHAIARSKDILKRHQTEYYLAILQSMGWEAGSRAPRLYISKRDVEAADRILVSEGIGRDDVLVGLSPGAVFGGAKRWPAQRFAEIGDLAAEKWGARVLVFGSSRESGICRSVVAAMNRPDLDMSGRTSLGVAMGLIRRSSFFVTNDSGLMHIAAALSVPTVAIFGPTDPVATGPRGARTMIVRHDTSCAPCLKPECTEDHACMLGVMVREVWEAMERLKDERPASNIERPTSNEGVAATDNREWITDKKAPYRKMENIS